VIPDEAVEAAWATFWDVPGVPTSNVTRPEIRLALEAAAQHLLIHVHHHDIENHARSFNEGYETCMAQELADDPTTAQDWLDEKIREARAAAWEEGAAAAWSRSTPEVNGALYKWRHEGEPHNPYRNAV